MARVRISNVLEDMCVDKLNEEVYKKDIYALTNLNNHMFKLTLNYWKDSNDPHYHDLPDELVFKGTYKELHEQVYGSGLIESEYAYASKIKVEEKYSSLIQMEIKDIEVIK